MTERSIDREDFKKWAESVWDVSSVTDPEMSAALEAWEGRQPEIDALKNANKRLAFHNRELQKEKGALEDEVEHKLRKAAEELLEHVEKGMPYVDITNPYADIAIYIKNLRDALEGSVPDT